MNARPRYQDKTTSRKKTDTVIKQMKATRALCQRIGRMDDHLTFQGNPDSTPPATRGVTCRPPSLADRQNKPTYRRRRVPLDHSRRVSNHRHWQSAGRRASHPRGPRRHDRPDRRPAGAEAGAPGGTHKRGHGAGGLLPHPRVSGSGRRSMGHQVADAAGGGRGACEAAGGGGARRWGRL